MESMYRLQRPIFSPREPGLDEFVHSTMGGSSVSHIDKVVSEIRRLVNLKGDNQVITRLI